MSANATLDPRLDAPTPLVTPDRVEAIDLLRGLVMVLMALDHTRDYFHFGAVHGFDPLDLKTTTGPLFLTRWITHFCAPVFIFLAGTGAFLAGTRGKSKAQLSWFLITRGLWVIVLELTVIHWAGWSFAIDLHVNLAIVIWAIGWSMIVLAALVHLPLWAIAAFGTSLIVAHNAFDSVKPEAWGSFAWLWRVLHAGGGIEFYPKHILAVGYPLIPWAGVMAAGYAFGRVLQWEPALKRQTIFRLGFALTVAFVALRWSNVYGDPRPWTSQRDWLQTTLAMLDCQKYPPSLCYLLMTIGPALMLLSALDCAPLRRLKPLLVFGRVPMFYYLLHIPLVHGLAVIVETIRFGSAPWLFGDPFGPNPHPPALAAAGFGLIGTYVAWLIVIALLYPVCRWFADLKRRRRDAWLSYL